MIVKVEKISPRICTYVMSTRTVLLFCWLRMARVDTMGGRWGLLASKRSISTMTTGVSWGTICVRVVL